MEDRLTVSTLLTQELPLEVPLSLAEERGEPAAAVCRVEIACQDGAPAVGTNRSEAPSALKPKAPVRAGLDAFMLPTVTAKRLDALEGGLGSVIQDILPPLAPHTTLSFATSLASPSTAPLGVAPGAGGAAGGQSAGVVSVSGGASSASAGSEEAFIPEINSGGQTDAVKADGGSKKSGYDYYIVGNGADADVAGTSTGLALLGGSTDVDAAFVWMADKAAGGDFVVLRAEGGAGYNAYIDELAPELDSVATLVVKDRLGAADPFVTDAVRNAEAIFIAGGFQDDYIEFWKDTPLEDAIYDALGRDIPIGGTSAGLAVLGAFDYTALNGTTYSHNVLNDPYNAKVTLDREFLNPPGAPLDLLANTVTDSHFLQRDRMGRLIGFVARTEADGWVSPSATAHGLGINERTAVLVEADGTAQVIGNPYTSSEDPSLHLRSAYFLEAADGATVVAPKQPLTYSVDVVRVSYNPLTGIGDTFDLLAWQGSGLSYHLAAVNGDLSSSTGNIYG